MISWSHRFPRKNYLLGYLRIGQARARFHDSIGWRSNGSGYKFGKIRGDRSQLEDLRNSAKGRRCFVLGNGPSLANTDIAFLEDELTIGSNGLFKAFPQWGFSTDYLLFEDIQQTEIHGSKIHKIKNSKNIAALHTAHSIARPKSKNISFMNARLIDENYLAQGPIFSRDFSHIVYLSGTITFVALQLAYHLGCEEVYLLGVDFDYGPLETMFPPGKIEITEENINLVRGAHFSSDYYQIGDVIGVPDRELQRRGYILADQEFKNAGRRVFNVSAQSKLDVFERKDLKTIIAAGSGNLLEDDD